MEYKYTDEQIAIIESSEKNLKVSAVAGSGKTSTLVAFAEKRPDAKILYLAYNRSVKDNAIKKFPKNTRVMTAHGLAYSKIIRGKDVKFRSLTPFSIAFHLDKRFPFSGENKKSFFLEMEYTKMMMTNFLHSDSKNLDDFLNSFCDECEGEILEKASENTKILFQKMNNGEMPITHDFYLKLFHLSNPDLSYFDYILFDEAQDANPVMVDIVLQQRDSVGKILVGDPHQQIYSWRGAVNSLENVPFKQFPLSASFRFSNKIAKKAEEFIKEFKGETDFCMSGKGGINNPEKTAYLGRTNLGILKHVLDYQSSVFIEGGMAEVITAKDTNISLEELCYFALGNEVKNKFLNKFDTYPEFREFIKENKEIYSMTSGYIDYVQRTTPAVLLSKIENVKNKLTDKENASILFSTVHKSKGLEYDKVILLGDFADLNETWNILNDKVGTMEKNMLSYSEYEKLRKETLEEVHIYYVAMTRTKSSLSFANFSNNVSLFLEETADVLKELKEEEENKRYTRNRDL